MTTIIRILTLVIALAIGVSAARAAQSCDVDINCAWTNFASSGQFPEMGTLIGNPAKNTLVVAADVSDGVTGTPPFIETSISCSPGNPDATVFFDNNPTPSALTFITTQDYLVGLIRLQNSGTTIVCVPASKK